MSGPQGAEEAAAKIEEEDNDIRRAVTTWDDCDIAAILPTGQDATPATQLGEVVKWRQFDAALYSIVKIDMDQRGEV